MAGLLDSWIEQLMQGKSQQPVGILGDLGAPAAAQGGRGGGVQQMMGMSRSSVGPIPEMGILNMRPDMLQFMQRQPGLAQLLLGMMSPQGQQVPPTSGQAPQAAQAMYGQR